MGIRCRSVFRAFDCRTPCRHQLKLAVGELCTKLMVRVYVPRSIVDKMTKMLVEIGKSFNLIFLSVFLLNIDCIAYPIKLVNILLGYEDSDIEKWF